MLETPLSRYARILETVAASPQGLTLSVIAERADLQPGASHRLVNSLCEVGLLSREEGKKTYVLGSRMIQLSLLAITPGSVINLARPILRELVNAHGETAYLTKLSGTKVESIAMETPQAGSKSYVQPGRMMPFHASAAAKAIFAYQPEDVIERLLAEPRTRFSADTKMEEADIRAELQRVRDEGFAICDNELDPGVLGYAAPVEMEQLGVIFSIGVVGLSSPLRAQPRAVVRASLKTACSRLALKMQGRISENEPGE
jgi:DNA-binding IclR family transcriptional regulator